VLQAKAMRVEQSPPAGMHEGCARSAGPGRRASEGAVEQWGQVRVAAAFESPDTLQSALAFLREYAADTGAHAACAVVRRRDIAFPQARRAGFPTCLVLTCGCSVEPSLARSAAAVHLSVRGLLN